MQIARAVGAQQCKIGIGIDAEHARVGDDALMSRSRICFDDADHMAVGQHQAIGRNDDAGAEPATLAVLRDFGPVSTRTTAGPMRSVTPITALE